MRINKSISIIFFTVFSLALTAMRVCQIVFNIRFDIPINNGRDSINTFWVTFGVFAIILFLLVMFGRADNKNVETATLINPYRIPLEDITKYLNTGCGIFFLLLSVATIYDGILLIQEITKREEGAPIRISTVVLLVFMFFSVLDFLFGGIHILGRKGLSKGHGGWFMAVSVMHLIYAFRMIVDVPMLARDPENLIIMASHLAAAAFFITASRFFVGYERSKTRPFLVFWGYMLSILEFCSVIPRFLILFFGTGEQFEAMKFPSPADSIMMVLPILVIIIFWGEYKYKEMPKFNRRASTM